ncbi:MAG: hypothetical protein ACPLW8_05605 [Candidatus Bathyarchaeales archaeon]
MNKKLLTAVLVPLTIMLVAGFGFAAFTAQVNDYVSATAGTFDIDITGSPTVTCSASYMTGTVTHPNINEIDVTVTNFAPGDYATVVFNITNTGSLPGNLNEQIIPTGGLSNISPFTYSDNLPSSISPGQTVTVTATITLPSGTSNTAQRKRVTFNVAVIGTAGS